MKSSNIQLQMQPFLAELLLSIISWDFASRNFNSGEVSHLLGVKGLNLLISYLNAEYFHDFHKMQFHLFLTLIYIFPLMPLN